MHTSRMKMTAKTDIVVTTRVEVWYLNAVYSSCWFWDWETKTWSFTMLVSVGETWLSWLWP